MTRRFVPRTMGVVVVLLMVALGWVLLSFFEESRSSIYRIYDSPKGKYHLIVYARPSLSRMLPTMPGNGGITNGEGFVRLYGTNGTIYGEAAVPWLQHVDSADSITWGDEVVLCSGDDGFRIRMPRE